MGQKFGLTSKGNKKKTEDKFSTELNRFFFFSILNLVAQPKKITAYKKIQS